MDPMTPVTESGNEPEVVDKLTKLTLEHEYVRLLQLKISALQSELDKKSSVFIPDASDSVIGDDTDQELDTDEESDETAEDSDDAEDYLDDEVKSIKTETTNHPKVPTARVRFVIRKFNKYGGYDDHDRDLDQAAAEDIDDIKAAAEESSLGTIIFRRIMSDTSSKQVRSERIEIDSPAVKRLYREIVGDYVLPENRDYDRATRLILTSPFTQFAWHWKTFVKETKVHEEDSEEQSAARQDLGKLLTILRSSQLKPYLKVLDSVEATGRIPFAYLWTLFCPGTRVFSKTFLDEVQMLEVSSCGTPSESDSAYNGKKFSVYCLGLDWNGSKFEPVKYEFVIQKPEAVSEQAGMIIDQLEVYPVKYSKKQDDTIGELKQRGLTFWNTCNHLVEGFQFQYSGPIITHGSGFAGLTQSSNGNGLTQLTQFAAKRASDMDDSMSTFSGIEAVSVSEPSRKNYQGQIIVDPLSFLRAMDDMSGGGGAAPLGTITTGFWTESECKCRACETSTVIQWARNPFGRGKSLSKQFEEFKEDTSRLAMCPPRVLGYILKDKTWAQFKLKSCKTTRSQDEEARDFFRDQLQLDKVFKKMLLACVNSHGSVRSGEEEDEKIYNDLPESLDVVEGKGKGLAILLHGPPGVGKTLTAETIALATERPLLAVSVAEVGSDATQAESRLKTIFAVAARWGAILLIDEADVFLEERVRTDNPNRNMLVSVLLRCLEYYEGIIFLTTNRIRAIDIAVQSRMHFTIQYKRLKQGQKLQIYKNLIRKIGDSKIKGSKSALYRQIDDNLCRRNDINGRQIRNIVSMGLALCNQRRSEGESEARLTYDDLRAVHEMTVDSLTNLSDVAAKAHKKNEAAEAESEEDSE